MPIHSGDELCRGTGPRQADADLRGALASACRRHRDSIDSIAQGLAVEDADLWRFLAWFQGIEHAALKDTTEGGSTCSGGRGDGDGIPLSTPQRLVAEVPILLRRLMEDPARILRAVDLGLTYL